MRVYHICMHMVKRIQCGMHHMNIQCLGLTVRVMHDMINALGRTDTQSVNLTPVDPMKGDM